MKGPTSGRIPGTRTKSGEDAMHWLSCNSENWGQPSISSHDGRSASQEGFAILFHEHMNGAGS
jgi:hypothetical protein